MDNRDRVQHFDLDRLVVMRGLEDLIVLSTVKVHVAHRSDYISERQFRKWFGGEWDRYILRKIRIVENAIGQELNAENDEEGKKTVVKVQYDPSTGL